MTLHPVTCCLTCCVPAARLAPRQARAPLSDLLVWQRVNHFPEAKQLTRKDLLKKHLVRYQVGGATG
jgi:hypothetical protein